MNVFLHILAHNIIPVFIIIGIGFIMGKKFEVNLFTLSKFTIYVFVPAFVFFNLYTADLSMDMLKILLFSITYMGASWVLGNIISRVRKFDKGMTSAFENSIMFNNSGNIGISLITLVFGSAPYIINGKTPYLHQALAAQVIILIFMNITMNTLGFYNAGRAKMAMKDSVYHILTMPAIYAILLALLLKYLHVDVESTPFWPALLNVKDGLVPMALLTLGTQLSKTKFDFMNVNVNISVFTRLVLGPLMAVIFIHLFGFTGVIAQTILISYSVPTAVNTVIIAVDCKNCENFASQQVMVSTIFSAVTLTTAIFMAGILFPL
ncbi:MAG: AEC family transporter [Solirubrobacterales bacterium]